jgi:nucleotide-binding universal stress UspA family protein
MKILCATDLQPKSDAAVDRAYHLRDSLNAHLALLHVVPPLAGDDGTLEQRLLSASSRLALRARHAGPPAELVVRCGRPASVLSEEGRTARLIVIGPHEADGFADALRGTFSERVISEIHCPLLIVRKPARQEYRQLLLALDGSPATRTVIRAAEALPVGPNAGMAVVHAHEPPYEAMMNTVGVGNLSVARYASASLSQAAAMIHAQLRQYSRHPGRYRVTLADARPAPAIRNAAAEVKPDLLVLGTRGYGRLRRVLLGSTAQEVLRDAQCDVLLVPDSAIRSASPPRR